MRQEDAPVSSRLLLGARARRQRHLTSATQRHVAGVTVKAAQRRRRCSEEKRRSLLGFLSHSGSAEVPAEGGRRRCTDRRRRLAGVLTAEGGRRRRRREGRRKRNSGKQQKAAHAAAEARILVRGVARRNLGRRAPAKLCVCLAITGVWCARVWWAQTPGRTPVECRHATAQRSRRASSTR